MTSDGGEVVPESGVTTSLNERRPAIYPRAKTIGDKLNAGEKLEDGILPIGVIRLSDLSGFCIVGGDMQQNLQDLLQTDQ
jgi:hypothetical protein